MSLQEALKLLRLELGMTQADLAKKLKKAYITVNRWENGKGFPSRSNAKDILALAKRNNASAECISYLKEMLMPESKRALTATAHGFPEIDREFLFQLADGSVNSLYVIEAETYHMLYVNRKAEETAVEYLSGQGEPIGERKLAEQQDKRCFHYFANADEPCSFCPLREFEQNKYKDKMIAFPHTGKAYRIHAKAAKMKGRAVYVIYLTDITETKAERNALYELTNDIPIGVGIYHLYLDDTIKLAFMNTVFLQMIGEERQEAVQRNELSDFCLIHPEDKKQLMAEIKEAIFRKRNIATEIRMRIRKQGYHRVHLSARLIKKDQEKFTYYCLFREIEPCNTVEGKKPPLEGV